MPQSSTVAATGHNSQMPLTEEEQSALSTYYELKIIADQRKVAAIEVDLKSARSLVNGHFKRMTADLGISRKEFEAEVIETSGLTDAQWLAREGRRTRIHRLAGRKVGEQQDLVDLIADTVDEANAAENAGYRAGRRADEPVPPKEISPILVTDWMRGYHAGQEFNGLQLAKAAEVMARPKPGTMVAGADPDEAGEDETDPDTNDIDAEAMALKASGWAQPTEAEVQFETSDNGRAIRKPKANGKAAVGEAATA